MSTITAPLRRPPHTLGSRFAPTSSRFRQLARHLRRVNEGLDADRHASLTELTLRPYPEARFNR